MEDALISPAGFMILSGAGLIEAEEEPIQVHRTEQTDAVEVSESKDKVTIKLDKMPYDKNTSEHFIYVMLMENGEVISEPFIPDPFETYDEKTGEGELEEVDGKYIITISATPSPTTKGVTKNDLSKFTTGCVVLVDYYSTETSKASQIDITPDKFGGNYYLEASTLWRDTNGVDVPAEFIIPNCKIQSNFTFTMASSGDPSTFSFTMDAFPDYTRFNKTKKVLAAIQVIEQGAADATLVRTSTAHDTTHDKYFD